MVAAAPLPRALNAKKAAGGAQRAPPAALHKPTVHHAISKVVQSVFDAGVMTVDLSASSEAEEAGQLPSCMPHRGCSIHMK